MAGADVETSPEDGEEDPRRAGRPERARAGVIDELFAQRVREQREQVGMSQSELGRRMAALGWPWHPQTVQRVEGGTRKVSIGEAEAIAEILGTSTLMLTTLGREATLGYLLGETLWRVRDAWKQISAWAATFSHQHSQLATTVDEAEKSPFRDSEHIAGLLGEAREALELNAEDAVADGLAEHEERLEEIRAARNPAIEDECY